VRIVRGLYCATQDAPRDCFQIRRRLWRRLQLASIVISQRQPPGSRSVLCKDRRAERGEVEVELLGNVRKRFVSRCIVSETELKIHGR